MLMMCKLLEEDVNAQNPNWRKHMAGIERLLEHRGPEKCHTPVSRVILEHCRNVLVRDLSELV